MKLNELIDCDINLEIKGLSTNTRDLKPGDLFICIKGASADRHNYIPQAIEKGIPLVPKSLQRGLPLGL